MTWKSALTALAFFIAILVLAQAQSGIKGTWTAEEVAFAPWTFSLQSDGAKLSGTVSQGGSNPATGMVTTLTNPVEIQDGTVDGNKISFKVAAPGGARTITFNGVVDGDSITFTRAVVIQPGGDSGQNGIFGASGATNFTAKRASAQPQAVAAAPRAAAAPAPNPANAQVVMLGTGTPIPDPDRSGPSVAVVAGGNAYIIDAGPGIVRRARAAADKTRIAALAPVRLNVLFLTHLHSDHTLGYPDLIFTPAVSGRPGALEVFGPKGTQEMTDHLLAAWKKDMDVRINGLEHGNANAYKVNVHEIDPSANQGVIRKDAGVTVKAFLVKHATWDQAFGYRFETPTRTIVISGDMAPNPAIAANCAGCDVLVHEVYCNPPGGRGGGAYYEAAHTSAAELAKIATEAKPKLLVLYHQLYTGCTDAQLVQQVQQGYSGQVVSAKDLDVF
jgi:ribonuclease BN (tRNA processing enzyme)